MVLNYNTMIKHFNLKRPNFSIGLFFTVLTILVGCNDNNGDNEVSKNILTYISPIDSTEFNYSSASRKDNHNDFSEIRFGQNLYLTSDKQMFYASINSDNELHTFNFKTTEHTYSKPICSSKIDAFKIDSSEIYLLYDSVFYVKDYQLNTLDSFVYTHPKIDQKHAIDFSSENNSNLFKIKNYFVLMYYVVDEKPDNTNVYKNTEYLFYYFNRDTSFFASKGCPELATTFQYFRYPAVASDGEFLYHTPRVINCISKSDEHKTWINSPINKLKNNYLSINPEDQYQISKLKRYRFSTDYNRDLILTKNNIYLIKEIPSKIYYEQNVRMYETVLELKKFDKQLNLIKTTYIKDKIYSYALIKEGKLLLFNFYKNKYYTYEI